MARLSVITEGGNLKWFVSSMCEWLASCNVVNYVGKEEIPISFFISNIAQGRTNKTRTK